MQRVTRLGVGLFALVLVVWMYFGFALDLQRRAATAARPVAGHVKTVIVPPSVEDMIRMPARKQVTVPPSVEDMIRMPAQNATTRQPSVEDLAALPALAQRIIVPPVVEEMITQARGGGPLSRSIIGRATPTPTPSRRVIDREELREQLRDPRARRRAVELEDILRRVTPTPTPTPTRQR